MIKFNVYDIAEEELMRKEFDINYQSAYHAALEKLTDEQRVFLYESSSKGKTVENAYYHNNMTVAQDMYEKMLDLYGPDNAEVKSAKRKLDF